MQLTDEQIEAAAKRIWASGDRSGYKWSEIASEAMAIYREMARAAAPFLQMPWEIPSDEEERQLFADVSKRAPSISPVKLVIGFIARRNASLIPKPVDPRRDKVVNSLNDSLPRYQSWDRAAAELLADRILAALDAKE
jgi:hypothetical protein